jgi:hypothetical protein
MNYTRMTKTVREERARSSKEIVIHLSRGPGGYEIVYDARGLRARALQSRDPVGEPKGAVTCTIAREGDVTWTTSTGWNLAMDRMADEIVETYIPLPGGIIKIDGVATYVRAARLNSVVRGILSESVRSLFGVWSWWKEGEAHHRLTLQGGSTLGSTTTKFDIIS